MISALFDLDGTLIDTSEGILNGIEEAERALDLTPLQYAVKRSFIGPPLIDSFMKYYGLSVSDAHNAVLVFREYYSQKGKYECVPYSGIEELLGWLRTHGIHSFVSTSKPTVFAVDILSRYELAPLFEEIIGSNLDNTRSKKDDIIRYILSNYNCIPEKTVMIGDKEQDVLGAKLTGIKAIGVTYGFGSKEEIQNSNPDMIAESPDKIVLFFEKMGWCVK